jgi:single-strand DNA-binding protein
MSKGINKAIILGNVGQIETKESAFGSVTRLSIATSDQWKDKATGEEKEKTEWHQIVLFGKLAEIAEKYVEKGSKIYIEGSLKTTKYTDASGVDKYSTQIVGKNLQLLGKSQGTDKPGQPEQPPVDSYDDVIPF